MQTRQRPRCLAYARVTVRLLPPASPTDAYAAPTRPKPTSSPIRLQIAADSHDRRSTRKPNPLAAPFA
jgi:hypothetical protein